MQLPERIETARLVLRRPLVSDAESIFENYAQDPEVTRYLVWRPHASVTETRAFRERADEGWTSGTDLTWALTLPPSESVIGMISLRPHGHHADIGYVLARRWWNQGFMTEAGRAIVQAAFLDPALFRLWALCDVENPGSARVLGKLGMVLEGTLRRRVVHPNISPEPRDSLLYALVR